ncbi:hypothetical protein TRSC58_01374 [Trypanosoma rangeli SC58]|uniref:Clu domain-containing protein n=1 Tax=Trypanosoma rangeli SC58 TaxID=429131 RepID=A0A061J967_TRYRA|nr:hypothetical protein TRSC58_01374 [Trypanosoma rangeli SC58]
MPTGNATLLLSVLRAAALSGCLGVEQAATNVGSTATVSSAQAANALRFSASPASSASWPRAICECHDHHLHEEASLWVTALRYNAVTTEARRLGFDALQRGELRRRANLFFSLEKWHAPGCGDTAADMADETLAAILNEEVDGCRAWTDVANGRRYHMSFVLSGGGGTARVEEAAALDAAVCGHADPTHADCVRLLLYAIAVVSAMLNHFRPLRWAIAISTGIPRAWEQGLASFQQLLNDEGIVSFVMAEEIASAIMSAYYFPATFVQRCDTLLKEKREKMLPRVVSLQHLLKEKSAAAAFTAPETPRCALHMRTEAQLLDLKWRLQQELCERLAVASQVEQRSVEQAQQFKDACDLHRTGGRDSEACGSHPMHRKKGFAAVSCDNAAKGHRAPSNALSRGREAPADKKPKLKPETVASAHETAITASCWERTILEVWGARREAVFAVLRQYYSTNNGLLKHKETGGKTKAKEEVGSVWVADVLPGALSSQLRALIGVPGLHATRLFDLLRRWVMGERAALDARVYVAWALELVVFLLVANLNALQDVNLLSELMDLVKHLAGTRSQEDASLSPSLQQLPDALAVVLMDAVFLFFSTGAYVFAKHNLHGGRDGTRRWHVSYLLWELHSSCSLRRAVSMRSDGAPVVEAAGDEGVNALPFTFSRDRTEAVMLLTDVALRGGGEGFMVGPSPRQDVGFILTLIELLGHAVVAELQEISARMKRPLPQFLSEALWEGLLPLTTCSLHHLERIHRDCGREAVRRLLEFCRALVDELTPRWDYSIMPTRRLRKKALTVFTSPAEQEYRANQAIQKRVVKFASLLEGLLAGAADALPHLLPDSCSFSRMCNAVGLILYDVDGYTGDQLLMHLLRLRPSKITLDLEAHMAIIRCLSSMRHGCTLWEEAILHYKQAVDSLADARPHNPVAPHRCPHVPEDLFTARLLRCIGSSPLQREPRIALTLRIVAFARACGLPLSTHSYSSCLLNFTLRGKQPTGMFTGAPWCDALEWYNDAMVRMKQTLMPQRDPLCFQVACLQSLLAQGEWSKALLSLPLADIVRHHDGAAELGHVAGNVSFLLRLCASDRTRSCASAARSLLQMLRLLSLPTPGARAVNLEEMQSLCHVANTPPPLYTEVKAATGVPLFRHEAPLIPRPPLEKGGAWTHSLGISVFSCCSPCNSLDALVGKLEDAVLLGLQETTSDTAGSGGGGSLQPSARVRVRERMSRAFLTLKTVWSADDFLRRVNAADEEATTGEAVRSRLDTCYASVIVPLRRLERVRAEKRRGVRGRDFAPRPGDGLGGWRGPRKRG